MAKVFMPISTSLKWGVILGFILVLVTQILTWLGKGTSNWFIILTYFSVVVVSVLCLSALKSKNKGDLKFLYAALGMFILIIVSRYIFQLYMFVYVNYIDPEWIVNTSRQWVALLQTQGISENIIEGRINAFHDSFDILYMFTIEIIKYGPPQFILGMILSLYFVFKK